MYAVVLPILIRAMAVGFCGKMEQTYIYRNGCVRRVIDSRHVGLDARPCIHIVCCSENLQNEMCSAISAEIYLSGVVTDAMGIFGVCVGSPQTAV